MHHGWQKHVIFAAGDVKVWKWISMVQESGKGGDKAARVDRLKVALRENLKRRKAQARERGKIAGAPSTEHEASLHEQAESAPGTKAR